MLLLGVHILKYVKYREKEELIDWEKDGNVMRTYNIVLCDS